MIYFFFKKKKCISVPYSNESQYGSVHDVNQPLDAYGESSFSALK